MELLDYYYMFLRRKWLFIFVFVMVVLATVIWLINATPIFEARAKLLITDTAKGSAIANIMGIEAMGAASIGRADPVFTQMELIKTRPIMMEVIEKLQLMDEKGDLWNPDSLTKSILLDSIRNTSIIRVAYRDKNRQMAAKIVNMLAKVVVDRNRDVNKEEYRLAGDFIEVQLGKRKLSLQQAEAKLIEFQRKEETVSLSSETEMMVTRLATSMASKVDLESKIEVVKAKSLELNHKIEQMSRVNSPFIAQWKNEVNQLNMELTSLTAGKEFLAAEIDKINQEIRKLPPKEIAYARLVSDVKIEDVLYNNLLMKLEETKISEAAQIASIRVIEPAIVPKYPVFPEKQKTLLIGIIMGLAFGGSLILLLEYFDQGITDLDEVKEITNWPRLGVIPKDLHMKDENYLITREQPRSPIAESYRSLRTNIHYTAIDKELKIVMVTSSAPGEGKTTVIANLAVTQSILGKKVILVDVDLRKPKMHKKFGLKNTVGLTSVLAGSIGLEKAIQETTIPNFFVLTAGPIPPNPAELIESKKFSEMLEQLKEKFDFILLDSPPFQAVTDAALLFKKADGYVFVINIEKTTKDLLKQTVEHIKQMNLPPLGYVINNLALDKNKYYGKTYYYHYDYNSKSKPKR